MDFIIIGSLLCGLSIAQYFLRCYGRQRARCCCCAWWVRIPHISYNRIVAPANRVLKSALPFIQVSNGMQFTPYLLNFAMFENLFCFAKEVLDKVFFGEGGERSAPSIYQRLQLYLNEQKRPFL